jgi:hypothetical protein
MKDPIDFKDGLVNWDARQDVVTPDNIAKWHKGAVYHQFPDKRALRADGGLCIAEGWLPRRPIIGRETRVLAIGSCFARNFTLWLAEHGFNRAFPDSPYNALLRFNADFESPAVVAQQFRWAFDELAAESLLWIDKNRHLVEATAEGKRHVRSTLEQTDVLVLTLGLSEVWYDKVSGEPLWRALTEDTFDPSRHVFRVETLAQTLEWLEAIERIRKAYLPRMKIVFTVSPIPLKTTFRPVSAITANSVSKAILRAALDEFLRRHDDALGTDLYYFPAYEFVTNYFVDPFREDGRHLAPIVPGTIISFFVRHFCEAGLAGERIEGSLDSLPGGKVLERVMRHAAIVGESGVARELLVRIAELEEDLAGLQSICEARQEVIDGIKHEADERLQLVEELHKVAAERLRVIEALQAALARAGAKGGTA